MEREKTVLPLQNLSKIMNFQDLQKFINLNQVVTEVASALIGSIAIVICVPFTAIVASWLIHSYTKREQKYTISFDEM